MFDHGAQYFTVKSAEVQQLVNKWQASGIVADWEGRFGSLNVATGDFVEETVRTFGFRFSLSFRNKVFSKSRMFLELLDSIIQKMFAMIHGRSLYDHSDHTETLPTIQGGLCMITLMTERPSP